MAKKGAYQAIAIALALLVGLGVGGELGYTVLTNEPMFNLIPRAVNQEEGDVIRVARSLSASVVGVINYSERGDFYNCKTDERTGSGVVVDRSGLVVTNNHVVEGARRLVAVLPNGLRKEAVLVGRDPRTDLALLRIKGATELVPVRWADSDRLVVGQPVVAIGNPLGMEFAQSVTAGVISGLNRVITTDEGFVLKLIQTDAAINPGNSGGPLVNYSGEVVGINTIKIVTEGFEGMGFTIPSNQVHDVIRDLKAHGRVMRPVLGVRIVDDVTSDEAKYYRLPVKGGVAVVPTRGGPAWRAGLRKYDIIEAVNGRKINTGTDLQEVIFSHKAGEVVKLNVLRLQAAQGRKSSFLSIKVKLKEEGGFSR